MPKAKRKSFITAFGDRHADRIWIESCLIWFRRLDKDKTMHCIRTREIECDLTDKLDNLRDTYTADVISEPLPSANTHFVELPYTSAPRFCPYKESGYSVFYSIA